MQGYAQIDKAVELAWRNWQVALHQRGQFYSDLFNMSADQFHMC